MTAIVTVETPSTINDVRAHSHFVPDLKGFGKWKLPLLLLISNAFGCAVQVTSKDSVLIFGNDDEAGMTWDLFRSRVKVMQDASCDSLRADGLKVGGQYTYCVSFYAGMIATYAEMAQNAIARNAAHVATIAQLYKGTNTSFPEPVVDPVIFAKGQAAALTAQPKVTKAAAKAQAPKEAPKNVTPKVTVTVVRDEPVTTPVHRALPAPVAPITVEHYGTVAEIVASAPIAASHEIEPQAKAPRKAPVRKPAAKKVAKVA